MRLTEAHKENLLKLNTPILITFPYMEKDTYVIGIIKDIGSSIMWVSVKKGKGSFSYLQDGRYEPIDIFGEADVEFLTNTKIYKIISPIVPTLYKCIDIDTNKEFILKSYNNYSKLSIIKAYGYFYNNLFTEEIIHDIDKSQENI